MFFGPQEGMIVLMVVLLLFGGSKVPELARSLGKAKGEFKKGLEEGDEEEDTSKKEGDSSEEGD